MSTKTYYTHDNGGRPFKVVISPENQVKVYKEIGYNDNTRTTEYDDNPVYTAKPKKVFVGRSPRNKMTEFSAGYGRKFYGNSILLEMPEGEYIFVGHLVSKFKPESAIIKYVSPVGNNDVPYPYAIDSDGKYYLIIEDVVVASVPKEFGGDPYNYYYNNILMTTDLARVPPKKPVGIFEDIIEWSVDKNTYTMRYAPNANKDYDRLTEKGKLTMYIKKKGKKRRQKISKSEFVGIMERYGKLMGFSVMKGVKTIVDRVY